MQLNQKSYNIKIYEYKNFEKVNYTLHVILLNNMLL